MTPTLRAAAAKAPKRAPSFINWFQFLYQRMLSEGQLVEKRQRVRGHETSVDLLQPCLTHGAAVACRVGRIHSMREPSGRHHERNSRRQQSPRAREQSLRRQLRSERAQDKPGSWCKGKTTGKRDTHRKTLRKDLATRRCSRRLGVAIKNGRRSRENKGP